MAYADREGFNRTKALNAGASLLIQGAVLYGIVTGLTVVVKDKADKPLIAEHITRMKPVPPPPPKPVDEPAVTPKTPVVTQNDPILIPLAPPSPGPTLLPPAGNATGAPTPAPTLTPAVTPSAAPGFTPVGVRARNDPRSWASTNDYPARDQAEGHEGTVRYEVTVGPDGRASGCRVITSSGHPGLDAATCNLVSRRARFDAARDDTGAKVSGTYTGSIKWQIPQE